MSRERRGSSFFSSAFGFLKNKPTRVKTNTARKAGARILKKGGNQVGKANSGNYRAAEIVFEECACDAVVTLSGRRFLVNEVPRIPVPDCTLPNCKCSYVRYKDRRSWGEDRRALFSLKTSLFVASSSDERRKIEERRAYEESTVEASDDSHNFKEWGL